MSGPGVLDRYLRRLGVDLTAEQARERAARDAASATALLDDLLAAHADVICFEAVDGFTGTPVALDEDAVVAKLVDGRRGGYCHEHAALVRAVLADLGVPARPVLARVLLAPGDEPGAYTHQATVADVHGTPTLLDPGFGAGTPARAIPVVEGATREAPHGTFRLLRAADLPGEDLPARCDWVVQDERPSDGRSRLLYGFADPGAAPAPEAADLDMSSWYTSTRPGTPFVDHLVLARTLRDGSTRTLSDRRLRRTTPDGTRDERTLTDAADLLAVLDEDFGVEVPAEVADHAWRRLTA